MYPRSPNWFTTLEMTGMPCHRVGSRSLPAPASPPQLAHLLGDAPESMFETVCGTVLFLVRSRPVRDHVACPGSSRRTPLAVWCRVFCTRFEAASRNLGDQPGNV